MLRKGLVIVWLIVVFLAIGVLFYYNEWVYQLPTPVPQNYHGVAQGKIIPVNDLVTGNSSQPVFIHFFNPDCPCSRFNVAQFKALVNQYGSRIHFVVVVMSKKTYTASEIQDKLNLKVRVLFDQSIAAACGVYSTPQAVLLDSKHHLYYRGNYNSSRYCTNEKTSYARMALASLLSPHNTIVISALAFKAYGCSLPYCKN